MRYDTKVVLRAVGSPRYNPSTGRTDSTSTAVAEWVHVTALDIDRQIATFGVPNATAVELHYRGQRHPANEVVMPDGKVLAIHSTAAHRGKIIVIASEV